MKARVVIIGAGPAGLTAGYLLSKEEVDVVVLEADPLYVGGISRTVTYKGFHFDIGGHRFFSKSKAIEDLWTEILPNDMLQRPRSSRIFLLSAETVRSSPQAGNFQVNAVSSFVDEGAPVPCAQSTQF